MRRLAGLLVRDFSGLETILKDAGLTTASAGASSVLAIARAAAIARYLGVATFGAWGLLNSANTLAQKIVSVRGWEWVMVHLSKAVVAKDGPGAGAVFKAGIMIGAAVNFVALAAVWTLGEWIATTFLHDASLGSLLRLNALSLFVTFADETSLATQRTLGRFRWLAVYQITASALRLLAIIPVLAFGLKLTGLIVATIAVQALASVTLLYASMAALNASFTGLWRGSIRLLWRQRRSHARTLATLSVIDTVKTLFADADAFVVGYFATPAAVGVYRAAQNIVVGLQYLAGPYYMVFYPAMAKAAAAGDRAAIRRTVRQMAAVGLALGGTLAALVAPLAPLLIPLLYGPGFEPSIQLLQVMIWSLLAFSAGWANPLFVSLGQSHRSLLLLAGSLAVKIILVVALVPSYSYDGAAVASLVGVLVTVPAAILLARGLQTRAAPAVQAA